ncbi:hypothetical protein M3Y98_00710500 [Aphelenchoides besseyi]|nr:hypothetical protein M3Y98_00710500 [Aphelenchoides besseyi]
MSFANQTISELLVVGNVTEANCKLAMELNRSPWMIGVVVVHMFVAVCGLFGMYKYFQTEPVRKAVGLVGVNLKIISVIGFGYYFWGFASAIVIYLYRIYIYARPLEPCSYIWDGSSCYFVYSQHASVNIMGYSVSCSANNARRTFRHFTWHFFCERIYSTFIDTIRGYPPLFGLIAGFLVLFFPPYWIISHYYTYVEAGIINNRVYCAGPMHSTATVSIAFLSTFINLLAIDVIGTIGDFCLLLYNKRQIARKITNTYTLARSFSLHGAQISIRLIYPFSIIHSLSFCTSFLFYIFYLLKVPNLSIEMEQFLRECVNLVRTFNNLILFSALYFIHQQQRTKKHAWTQNKNETEHYFKQFNQMIS